MTHVQDVAAFILKKCGPMTAMKLQKLVYYSQAWSLVWDERSLFPEKIEAWANGPVCPDLYRRHQGQFIVSVIMDGNPENLDAEERETIDAVLKFYGNKSAQWLSDLTHREQPWKSARINIPDGQRGNAEISLASMAEYYSGL